MSRRTRDKAEHSKQDRRGKRQTCEIHQLHPLDYEIPATNHKPCQPLSAMTAAQSRYMTAIEQSIITFGVGPAGTGKSFVAVAMACEALLDKLTSKIIITRPAIEVGKAFGALPGELEDKYAPYFYPVLDILHDRLGKSQTEYLLKRKRIEAVPLEYMLGVTFKDSWIILDEAQNTTIEQMEMFLTRIGPDCNIIVNGSPRQKYTRAASGLSDAMQRLVDVNNVAFVEFGVNDVVRSGIVADIIRAYES